MAGSIGRREQILNVPNEDITRQDIDPATLLRKIVAGTGISVTNSGIGDSTISTNDGAIDHDVLSNFVAGEHFLQSAITQVGTIATGVWQGTAIADTYIAPDITLTNITQITNRAHGDLSAVGTNTHAQIDTHIASTSDPHSVTKAQVGLGSVENTALSTWVGTTNLVTVGDLVLGGTNRRITSDTGDYVEYDTTSNRWNFYIDPQALPTFVIDLGTNVIDNEYGLRLAQGHTYDSDNWRLFSFDTGWDALVYNSTDNRYEFWIGSEGGDVASVDGNKLSIESGVLELKETTTPSALANYGKVYTKTDNTLYFQDGAGSEHPIVRTATVVVAASDSNANSKSAADYVCDGTADNVEIQAAITSLTGSRTCIEKILLLPGNYLVAATITIPDYTHLENWGRLYTAANHTFPIIQNADTTNGNDYIVISNGIIDGQTAEQTSTDHDHSGIYLDECDYVTVRNITFKGIRSLAVLLLDCNYATITENKFKDNGAEAIGLARNTQVVVTDNVIESTGDNGISISRGNAYIQCVGNSIKGTYYDGIYLEGFSDEAAADHVTIVGNTIKDTGEDGIAIGGLRYSTVAHNIIENPGTRSIANAQNGIKMFEGAAGRAPRDNIQVDISHNIIRNVSETGIIAVDADACSVTNNIIYAADVGIFIRDIESILVTNNVIEQYTTRGIQVGAELEARDSHTVIKDNVVAHANVNSASDRYAYRIEGDIDVFTGNVAVSNTNAGAGTLRPLYIAAGKTVALLQNNYFSGNETNSPTISGAFTSMLHTVQATKTPASAGAAGTMGDICWDTSYIYVCTAANTWERVAIASW